MYPRYKIDSWAFENFQEITMNKNNILSIIKGSKPVDKVTFIMERCKGMTVLDLGCVRHNADFAMSDPMWLHHKIKSVANKVVGVDWLPEEVQKLNSKGYEILTADVTKPLPIKEAFDVIVAGDLIEHLSNFEGFFENCQRLLKTDGILLISTPNPFYSDEYDFVAFKRRYLINPEHTCWIDPQALAQLTGRFDFEIDNIHFIKNAWKLKNLICESDDNEYDILNGSWANNSISHKIKRKIIGNIFALFYALYKLLFAKKSLLVKHSDYLAVLKKSLRNN